MGAVIDLIERASEAGVIFLLRDRGVVLRGDPAVVPEWLPLLRRHRHEVLIEIQKRQAGMYRLWVIRPPLRAAFTVAVPQGATAEEVRGVWPNADVEPTE